MYKKYLNCYNILITGLLTLALGILILILNKKFLILTVYLISIILMVYAVSNVIKLFKKENKIKKRSIYIQIFLNIVISLIFCFFPNIPLPLFSLTFGLYIIFNGIVKLVNYIIFKRNNIDGRLIELFIFIFHLIFGLFCITLPSKRVGTILFIISLYFILLGTTYISDFITQMIPTKQKNKLKRKIKITLPVFLSVLIPHDTLMQINKSLSVNEYMPKKLSNQNEDDESDIEILIHVTKDGHGVTGHSDIFFENHIISYGNYDHDSLKIFETIGDGVLFFADDKQKYIDFCIKDSKKTIFVFGIKLTDKQKKAIKEKLDLLKENTYEWTYYKTKEYKRHNFYATRLSKAVNTKFYKFKKGKFKTYFVLGNNCISLVDYLFGASGSDILKINGFITPGTYYDFLATEYTKKNSNVISYKIYK